MDVGSVVDSGENIDGQGAISPAIPRGIGFGSRDLGGSIGDAFLPMTSGATMPEPLLTDSPVSRG